MKKYYVLLMSFIVFVSCSKAIDEEEFSTLNSTASVSSNSVWVGTTTEEVGCASEKQTADVEIFLTEPVEETTNFFFKVYKNDGGGWLSYPGDGVTMEPGQHYAKIETSCSLPGSVECGQTTGWYSSEFKYVLDDISSGTDTNFEIDNGTVFFTAYRYCLATEDPYDDGGSGGFGS